MARTSKNWYCEDHGYQKRTFEQRQKNNKAYYAGHSDRLREYANNYRKEHPWSQSKHYGLTKSNYDEMFKKQGSSCAVCKSKESGSKKGWHIDHDHETEQVRSILCQHCNVAIAMLRENVQVTEAVLEYLRKWKKDV